MIRKALGLAVSNVVFLAGRATGNARLLSTAFRLDDRNYRAAKNLYHQRVSSTEFESFLFDALVEFHETKNRESDSTRFLQEVIRYEHESRAQLFQDLFALHRAGWKRDGFFIEVGVGDGESLSNSWLLEQKYGWRGLLVEPNPGFHPCIEKKRTAALDRRAAFSRSGETVSFLCDASTRELSTIAAFSKSDSHQRRGDSIEVSTITLAELCAAHQVPGDFDYLSVDTEGSELEVLNGLDWTKHRPRTITVEHNDNVEKLEAIRALLTGVGYRQIFAKLSQWDAWFVRD